MATSFRQSVASVSSRLLIVVVLLLAVGASAYGYSRVRAAPPAPGEVLFCVNPFTGDTRVVFNTDHCTNGYVVSVNQQGLPGPPGPQGPPGPPGPAGTTNTIKRIQVDNAIAPGLSHVTTASCLPGEVATGGGYFSGSPQTLYPKMVGPEGNSDSQPTAWTVIWANFTGVVLSGQAFVVCAQP